MKKLIKYVTNDGQIFESLEEAYHYENSMQLGSILFREAGNRMGLGVEQCQALASVALCNLYVNSAGELKILEGDTIHEL